MTDNELRAEIAQTKIRILEMNTAKKNETKAEETRRTNGAMEMQTRLFALLAEEKRREQLP